MPWGAGSPTCSSMYVQVPPFLPAGTPPARNGGELARAMPQLPVSQQPGLLIEVAAALIMITGVLAAPAYAFSPASTPVSSGAAFLKHQPASCAAFRFPLQIFQLHSSKQTFTKSGLVMDAKGGGKKGQRGRYRADLLSSMCSQRLYRIRHP